MIEALQSAFGQKLHVPVFLCGTPPVAARLVEWIHLSQD